MIKNAFKKKYLFIVFTLIHNFFIFAQTNNTVNYFNNYIGSSQFFDISGEWVNPSDSAMRISRMQITPTIMNTFRAKPIFKIGGKEMPGKSNKMFISEKQLLYETEFAEAKCYIIPIIVNNQKKLKIYSTILSPDGQAQDIVREVLEQASDANHIYATNKPDIASLKGYWINEWNYDPILEKFQIILKDDYKKDVIYIRPYKPSYQDKAFGEFKAVWNDKEQGFIAKFKEREEVQLFTTMLIHPIFVNGVMNGFDLISEEVFGDNVPKNLYRQFFIKSPDSDNLEKTDEIINTIKGEWVNIDQTSATRRLVIDKEGELEIWVNSGKSEELLGHKPLTWIPDNDLVGTKLKGGFLRTIEIETKLSVNSLNNKPIIIVVNTTIEDPDGSFPTATYSEVFQFKGSYINQTILNKL